jgi:hypothetical protein
VRSCTTVLGTGQQQQSSCTDSNGTAATVASAGGAAASRFLCTALGLGPGLDSAQVVRPSADWVLAILPWPSGLLDCCCLQWAQQLQLLPPGDAKAAAVAAADAAQAAGRVGVPGVLLPFRPVGQNVATLWGVLYHKVFVSDGIAA